MNVLFIYLYMLYLRLDLELTLEPVFVVTQVMFLLALKPSLT